MDPRNQHLYVHVGGRLVPRAEAKVSVFDSSVQGGDAVWEGLRVYDGRVFELDAHLERLERSAKAMAERRGRRVMEILQGSKQRQSHPLCVRGRRVP